MNLVFIHGPPAAGKLTVAKELHKITGYRLFHNHLTIDLAETAFAYGTKPFWKFLHKIRMELFEKAAKNKANQGIIFTFCYDKGNDDKFIKNVIKTVEKNNGKVLFVKLYCSEKELMKRVLHSSREEFGKIKKPETLKKVLKKYSLFSSIPFRKYLEIDNTKLSPKKAAEIIKNYYKL